MFERFTERARQILKAPVVLLTLLRKRFVVIVVVGLGFLFPGTSASAHRAPQPPVQPRVEQRVAQAVPKAPALPLKLRREPAPIEPDSR